MSKLNVDTIEPEGASTTLTLGASGDTVTIPSGATIDASAGTATGFPGFNKWTPVTATDATFDLQSGTTKLIIEVQAAGGGGGASNADGGRSGGPGGAGAYAKKLLTSMVDTDTLNITIGAAAGVGASGTTTSVASASGTSFTTITCTGGAGGVSANGGPGAGGAGGAVPTTGDLNIKGQDGNVSKTEVLPVSGANSMFGFGGQNAASITVAGAGSGYGSGGQGGRGTSNAGAAGTAGIVIIWEYK